MFVLVEGASKERAFEVGREIRDDVTAANPKPVKLKLEKVSWNIRAFILDCQGSTQASSFLS